MLYILQCFTEEANLQTIVEGYLIDNRNIKNSKKFKADVTHAANQKSIGYYLKIFTDCASK